MSDAYRRPPAFIQRVANPLLMLLIRAGIVPNRLTTLAVRGRTSGDWRTVPVTPLVADGTTYLVSPRGETDWVRNLRQAGGSELRNGRKKRPFTAAEIPVEQRAPLLRHYLTENNAGAIRSMFSVPANPDMATLERIVPRHPVFTLTFTGPVT